MNYPLLMKLQERIESNSRYFDNVHLVQNDLQVVDQLNDELEEEYQSWLSCLDNEDDVCYARQWYEERHHGIEAFIVCTNTFRFHIKFSTSRISYFHHSIACKFHKEDKKKTWTLELEYSYVNIPGADRDTRGRPDVPVRHNFIKWQGYSSSQNTWEQEEHLPETVITSFKNPAVINSVRIDECRERLAITYENGLQAPLDYEECLIMRHDVVRALFPNMSADLRPTPHLADEKELKYAGFEAFLERYMTVTGGRCCVALPVSIKLFLGRSPNFLNKDGKKALHDQLRRIFMYVLCFGKITVTTWNFVCFHMRHETAQSYKIKTCTVKTCIVKICTVKICTVKICTVKICTVKICTVKICTVKICTVKICTVKICTVKICIVKICTVKICTVKIYTVKICTVKICTVKICTVKICTVKTCTDKTCTVKTCIVKICSVQTCTDKICTVKICTDKICTVKTCTVKPCTVKVCTVKVCTFKTCTLKTCIVKICSVQTCTDKICTVKICRTLEYHHSVHHPYHHSIRL
ncbi:hypothetical protein QZH41_017704 [Actinostola sp. cb2023]|nr:hypothetical protein QZH41_017704 [Actinostola sp. cb2023]